MLFKCSEHKSISKIIIFFREKLIQLPWSKFQVSFECLQASLNVIALKNTKNNFNTNCILVNYLHINSILTTVWNKSESWVLLLIYIYK